MFVKRSEEVLHICYVFFIIVLMLSSHKTISDWKEKASQLNIKLAENKQKQSPKK
jgi:hypothetical protein